MQCSNCHIERPNQAGPCSNCGFAMGTPQPSLGRRNPLRLILLCFLFLSVIVLIAERVGTDLYHQMQAKRLSQRSEGAPASTARFNQLPVEHGSVAKPEELHGHGKLYFVPIGHQALSVQSLADYYN